MKAARGPRAVSIIALVFAPIALWISWAIYTRDTPLDRTPLLVGAIVVGVLEIAAAIATLARRPIGQRLFLAYGVLALIHVNADGAYLIAMPARAETHHIATDIEHTFVDGIGALLHVLWSFGAFAWPIVVLVLAARWRPKRFISGG